MKTKLLTLILSIFCSLAASAQQIDEKTVNKAFAVKGTHRAPFKNATEACLTSVNLQFKLGTRQEQEKRGVGNVITWGFLEGIDDTLMQEITDEYYKMLSEKLKAHGIALSDAYKGTEQYQKLIDNNTDLSREVEKKNWGVSKIFTANNAPYIEFPVGMMGAHSSLGNKLKIPVGMVFVTLDFITINQDIKKGVSNLWGERTDKFETSIEPIISVVPTTQGGKMKGDGSYARFAGNNWGFCNPTMIWSLASDVPYAATLKIAEGMPESMKKFKSAVLGDMAAIFSKGLVKSGRGAAENTFLIQADPQAYKKAALNALDKYNDLLVNYIKINN